MQPHLAPPAASETPATGTGGTGQAELRAAGLTRPIEAMRAPVHRGETHSLAWRLTQLERMETLLTHHQEELLAALADDLGKPAVEATFELVGLREELRHTRRGLRRWLRPRPVRMPLWAWPGKASVHPEPLGCVLILGAWNYPVQLTLLPAINALAAREQRDQALRAGPPHGGGDRPGTAERLSRRGGSGGAR